MAAQCSVIATLLCPINAWICSFCTPRAPRPVDAGRHRPVHQPGQLREGASDALNGVAWVDDKKRRRIVLERMEPDEKGARAEVEIEFIAAAPSLLDGVAA